MDSSDRTRISEAADELHGILADPEMWNRAPVTIMANKQDLPGAMGPSELIEALGMRKMGSRRWHVQGTCAKTGEGIYESMEAMARMVKEERRGR